MKEIEAKRKGKKPPTNVPYPEGVRRNKVSILNPDSIANDLEEDKKLLSSGMFCFIKPSHSWASRILIGNI